MVRHEKSKEYKVKSTLKPKFAQGRSTINVERTSTGGNCGDETLNQLVNKGAILKMKVSGHLKVPTSVSFYLSLLSCQMGGVKFKWHSLYIALP